MEKKENTYTIIPVPENIIPRKGNFKISEETKILIAPAESEIQNIAGELIKKLKKASNIELKQASDVPKENYIRFAINDSLNRLGDEGYKLNVSENCIEIDAYKPNGLFYGVQTVLQMLPAEVYSLNLKKNLEWLVPCASIEDKPRFSWRGMHLDVCRHFFPKEFILKYIDMLAMHKMNVFHWHLTEDQGWRIEIKQYPKLTEVGAWRADRTGIPWRKRKPQQEGEATTYGGFYTQDDVKEIIAYAQSKYITVIPEIEMPAHCVAALASYPELSCTGGPYNVMPGTYWPNKDVFCAGNDSVFVFLENVLSEVIDLFPSKYIHIGGDEAEKSIWKVCKKCQARIQDENLKDEDELQSYFVKRIEKFIISKGRKLIGWDEILEGGLAPEATVMSWRGMKGGIEAAEAGHDVIMSPTSHCYFDYYQADPETEPEAIGGFTTLRKVYSFEPVPEELTGEKAKHILGAQANVWTEFMETSDHVEYMVMPRLCALAEVVWSPKKQLNWDSFIKRIQTHYKRLDYAGINYSKGSFNVDIIPKLDTVNQKYKIDLQAEQFGHDIKYTLDGTEPLKNSKVFTGAFVLDSSAVIKAALFKGDSITGKIASKAIKIHKAIGKKVVYKSEYHRSYTGKGKYGLVDGIFGSKNIKDGHWQGFQGVDLDVIVDLGEMIDISSISTSWIHKQKSWIFLPESVTYFILDNNETFDELVRIESEVDDKTEETIIKTFAENPINRKARYIKVIAKNKAVCPEWHQGAGDKAWIFIDEIIVE